MSIHRLEIDGVSADMGPYEDCPGVHPDSRETPSSTHHPWCDLDEFLFHGVIHTWRGDGHGWVVPYDGCIVQFGDWEPPDDAHTKPPGVYEVDDDWDDTEVYLDFVEATS